MAGFEMVAMGGTQAATKTTREAASSGQQATLVREAAAMTTAEGSMAVGSVALAATAGR